MADYTLLQAQQDVASLRGQLAHLAANAEFINMLILGTATGQIVAFDPTSSPQIPETWHVAALASGWTAANGTTGLHYRLTAQGTVQVFCSATHVAFTSGTNLIASDLPTAYIPTNTWNIGCSGIPNRAGAEINTAGMIIAEANGVSCTEVDIAGEYPLGF